MIGNRNRSIRPIWAFSGDLLGQHRKSWFRCTRDDGMQDDRRLFRAAPLCLICLFVDEIRSRLAEDVLNRLPRVGRQVSKRFTLVLSTENEL